MTERKWFMKRDLLLIAGILLAALVVRLYFLLHPAGTGLSCRILYNGDLVRTVDLSQNTVFSPEQNPHVVFEVRDGAIAFIRSDCPDQICVHSGFLSQPGQMAACLPNRFSIHVMAADGSGDVDMIAQ